MESHVSLIDIVESRAKAEPSRIWMRYPASNDNVIDLRDITYSALKRAIDRLAWWMVTDQNNASINEQQPAAAYIGPSDVRYLLVLLAAIKAKYLIMFPSHRNSLKANESLLAALKCSRIFHAADISLHNFPSEDVSRKARRVPSLEILLSEEPSENHFPYQNDLNRPLMCTHTSGSTGLPRPIIVYEAALSLVRNAMAVSDIDGRPNMYKIQQQAHTLYLGFPIFHYGATAATLVHSLLFGVICIMPPSGRALDGHLLLEVIRKAQPDAALCTPRALEGFKHMPEAINELAPLKWIMSGGALLPPDPCAQIAATTRLLNRYASTETFPTVVLHSVSTADWDWMHISPRYNCIEWRPVGELFEMVIKRDSKMSHLQGVFKNFPELDEFATKDLFARHPTKPDHWRIDGRTDHLINFANASTFFPAPVEANIVQAEPVIQTAFVIGNSRPFPSLLVELVSSSSPEQAATREKVLAAVRVSNVTAPANGQIEPQHIIIVSNVEKPLPRTGKDTVSKTAALDLYAQEIEQVYTRARENGYDRDINVRLEQ